jgi:Aspartyl protease
MYRGGRVSARPDRRPAHGLNRRARLSLVALLLATPAFAQSSAPQPPPAQQPDQSQQPGQSAQVHTGTSSGLSLDARLQNLLADHQYFRVQAELNQLPPELAQLYRGVLANRSNDLKSSIQLLEPLIAQVTASGNVAHEKLLRETLAEDYLRSGDWSEAAAAYTTLESRLSAQLSPDEQADLELPVKLLPLAKDNPPMTVDPCEAFTMQASEDPLGLLDIPVFVDADSKSWMLDPTAPFNLMDRATAVEMGVKMSVESATIRTLTGRPIQVHMAVIPRFTIGGRLTLHNMTVFVFDDADYFFPHTQYQVEGVLGYPALAALGSITVTDENNVQVRPAQEIDAAEKADLLTTGVPFFLDGDQIIVPLGRSASSLAAAASSASAQDPADPPTPESGHSDDRMYAIDAGGQQTYLTSRYFDEHAAQFNGRQISTFSFPGLQSGPQSAYVAETVPLVVGRATVNLHYLRVLTQPVGSAALDDVYGVLGIDALDQLGSYTFDYRTMRFSVRPE